MQPQMNPSPHPSPQGVPATPAPGRPRSHSGIAFLLLVVLASAGWFAWRRAASPSSDGGGGGAAAVRTVAVTSGSLQRTLRLTGTTTAEKFAALVAPQLRGGRGGGATEIWCIRRPGWHVGHHRVFGLDGIRARRPRWFVRRFVEWFFLLLQRRQAPATSAVASAGSTAGGSGGSSSAGFRGASNRFGSSSSARSSSFFVKPGQPLPQFVFFFVFGFLGWRRRRGGGDRMSGGTSDFMQVLQSAAKPGSAVRKATRRPSSIRSTRFSGWTIIKQRWSSPSAQCA